MKFFLRNDPWPDGITKAAEDLQKGVHRHDVLEMAIRAVEGNPEIDTVGYGGRPNLFGVMQLDAAFMNGDGRQLGAVGALSHYRHPVSIARQLMQEGVHTLLAGTEGELFAREKGFEEEETLSPQRRDEWERKVKPLLDANQKLNMMLVRRVSSRFTSCEYDTAVMIASDGQGLSLATSSSGWDYKYPGRVGDAPIAGAGFYVDSVFGACVCTRMGEMSMRAGTARYVVAMIQSGLTVKDAVLKAVDDLAGLSGGTLGSLCIHAVNPAGDVFAVAANAAEPVSFWYWNERMAEPELRSAEPLAIPARRSL